MLYQSLYETNSSSVHALVIPKKAKLNIPESTRLHAGFYGWECNRADALGYFYVACCDLDCKEKLFDFLRARGVKNIREYGYPEQCIIDHAHSVPVNWLFDHPDILERFLFSDESFCRYR